MSTGVPSFVALLSGVLSQSFPSSCEISARFVIVAGGFAATVNCIETIFEVQAAIFVIVRFAILPLCVQFASLSIRPTGM